MNVTEARYYLKLRTNQTQAPPPASPIWPLPPMQKCDRDAIETILEEIHRLNLTVSSLERQIDHAATRNNREPLQSQQQQKPTEKPRHQKPTAARSETPTTHKTRGKRT